MAAIGSVPLAPEFSGMSAEREAKLLLLLLELRLIEWVTVESALALAPLIDWITSSMNERSFSFTSRASR